MSPGRRALFLEVVDHEESIEVEDVQDEAGRVTDTKILESTRRAFLHLRTPNGTLVRAEIPARDLDPLLAVIYPDFVGPSA